MREQKLISAAAMAYAVDHDPQFHLPVYPRFADSTVIVPLSDGLLVEGTAERQVFRGKAAVSLLPRLFPLLNGSRKIAEVCSCLPDTPPEAVRNAVALLYTRGLLDEGGGLSSDHSDFPPEVVDFFRRHVDVTRVNRSAEEALQRVRAAHLLIAGRDRQTAMLEAELLLCGFRYICKTGSDEVDNFASSFKPDLIVALVHQGFDQTALDDMSRIRKIPWLRVALAANVVQIGPYFEAEETLCYRCFTANVQESSDLDSTIPLASLAWLSLTATELLHLISKICPPLSVQDFVHLNLDNWTQTRFRLPKRPGCKICHPTSAKVPLTHVPLALVYEQAVTFPSKRFLSPKDHQIHYRLANLELQHDQKLYPSAPLVPLPIGPAPVGGYLEHLFNVTPRNHAPNRETISGLLLRGGGLREPRNPGQKVQRWAPTGGNLGSVQIYAMLWDVVDLLPGCYFYQPSVHGLVSLLPERSSYALRSLAAVALPDYRTANLAGLFVLTGALSRLSAKYGLLGFRIAHLDAGVAVAQMQAVARGYGLRLAQTSAWNDEVLIEELGLNGAVEPVTAVLALGAQWPSRRE